MKTAIAAIVILLAGLLAGCLSPGKDFASEVYEQVVPTPDVAPPSPEDFTVAVNVIERSCNGSSGCNVRYKIYPDYTGVKQPDTAEFTVVYQVAGCDDEKRASFEMRGERWNAGLVDWDYCISPYGEISAQVIQVLP